MTGVRRLADTLRWRPEWPFALLVVAAWGILLAGRGGHADAMAGMSMQATGPLEALRTLPGWAVMAAGMMLPLALPAVGHVGLNSLRVRRWRAMALFVAVYLGVWVGFGLLALAAAGGLRAAGIDDALMLAAALGIAAAWQLSPAKRQALFRCRRTVPLPPVGLRADVACARFAVLQGWRCLVSCWALMLAMAVFGHGSWLAVAAMVAMTLLVLLEDLTPLGDKMRAPSAGVLALAAGIVALGR